MIRMGITKKENHAAPQGETSGNDAKNTHKIAASSRSFDISPATHDTSLHPSTISICVAEKY